MWVKLWYTEGGATGLRGWSEKDAVEDVAHVSDLEGWAEFDQEKQEDQTEETVMVGPACWGMKTTQSESW